MVPRCFGKAVHNGESQAFVVGAFSDNLVYGMFIEEEKAGEKVMGEAFLAVPAAPYEDGKVFIQFVCDFTAYEEAVGLSFLSAKDKISFSTSSRFPVYTVSGDEGA